MLQKNVRLDAKLLKKTGVFTLVSAELLGCIGAGVWLGSVLDKKLGTKPVFVAVLSMVGLGYSVWRIKRFAKREMNEE
jgi:F0F1-type ATP synthase assembly protein I